MELPLGPVIANFYPCLHSRFEYHPSQKCPVLNTLIQYAKIICNDDNPEMEITQLKKTFRLNGYRSRDVMHAFSPQQRSQTQMEKPAGIVMIV
jgi:hypothetical protein